MKANNKANLFIVLFLLFHTLLNAQDDEKIFERLNGLKNNGFDFYNVDGYEISFITMSGNFDPKTISKRYRGFKLKADAIVNSDSSLPLENYVVHKQLGTGDELEGYASYYFMKTGNKDIAAVSFVSNHVTDLAFQRHFVGLILGKKIPDNVYSSPRTDSVNFGGRKLYLGGVCHWMNPNNIQCSGNGQMNWSVCKSQEQADFVLEQQRISVMKQTDGKVINDEMVDILFEGTEVKARKVIWDFTGITSVLVGMTGGKTLTIFFVSAPVRGNFISCVLSFWNNDRITKSGLAPLLDEVMTIPAGKEKKEEE
ncbi:MAG TPA: hypothetical protein PK939_09930 [Bacteroidales bacterium]|nr:hypothetical protein [Bacteroidales bacterium]